LPAGCRWRVALAMPAMPPAPANFYLWQLAGRVRRLANGLCRLGVGRGDRVAWPACAGRSG
jgi:hypothetical protein